MLGLLALVNGRGDQNGDELSAHEHREALIDLPAEDLKQMILSLLQEEGKAAEQGETK